MLTLHQSPAFAEMPSGTDWIYSLTSTDITGNYKFKYFADIFIGQFGATYIVRVFFSPNADGTGIINLSDIYEQYVSSSNLGNATSGYQSAFKSVDNVIGSECPIHCIDKFSLNNSNYAKASIAWGQEYSTNPTDAPTQYSFQILSMNGGFTNSVAYNNEQLRTIGTSGTGTNEYGLNFQNWNGYNYFINSTNSKFLTDAPNFNAIKPQQNPQLIRDNDYATLAFLNGTFMNGDSWAGSALFVFNQADGTYISQTSILLTAANGGYPAFGTSSIADSERALLYLGVGTANLIQHGTALPAGTGEYFVTLMNTAGTLVRSETKGYKIQNNDCKGFETIRLTWLNKYGVWDYYNFTKKNIKSTEIKRTTYSKIKGQWNGLDYTKNGYDRGSSTLSTMANEVMALNSDWFSSDDEAAWLEQLFISPEVYILGGLIGSDTAPAEYGKYLTPVEITNKKYVKYTEANDKVSQYEVEIKYSINKRVQRA